MTRVQDRGYRDLSVVGLRPGDSVVVFGLARSGFAAACLLADLGVAVTVTDQQPAGRLPSDWIAALGDRRVRLALGGHPPSLVEDAALIVVSPGVPLTVAPLAAARAAGGRVIGEFELGWRLSESAFVAVTGTNGKSTATALIGHLLTALDRPVRVAGNIGNAVCGELDQLTPETILVVEASSYQLEICEAFHPWIGVLLNLTPDHLDRHGDMAGYAAAKARLYRRQSEGEHLIANADDAEVSRMAASAPSRVTWFSLDAAPRPGLVRADGWFHWITSESRTPVVASDQLRLPGEHNQENAAAAIAAACVAGVPHSSIPGLLAQFDGLPHRIEWCGRVDGIDFYNDSKGTNIDAVVRAIDSFDRPIVLIAGGKDKGAGLEPLVRGCHERVRLAILIGEAAGRFAGALSASIAVETAPTLESAVVRAREAAAAGDVVLLSPGCASFDMFRDFEHRGEVFKSSVGRLGGLEERREGAVR